MISSYGFLILGVGASCYLGLSDQVVKFPSKINRLNFSAQQITEEKQGVQIDGVLVWAINRENDGPGRAYRFLGDDLTSQLPTTANETLKDMSNSIVRHRIANSSIEDILKKRDEIRNEIRTEMQKIVTGWGVWLESVEITEVKILSSSLFHNLQIEFREEQRKKAEIIQLRTDSELEELRIKHALDVDYQRVENESKKQIFAANESLKVENEKQKLFEKEQELQIQKVAAEEKVQKFKLSSATELEKHRQQLLQEETRQSIEREKETELLNRELLGLREETNALSAERRLAVKALEETQGREADRLRGEMENAVLSSLDYSYAALNTAKEIYSNLEVKELKMVNMSGDDRADGVMQLVNRLVASAKVTTEAI
jgi:flotillin